ncbi:DUF6864 domain-containing function [Pseudomonas salmasensis]|jgi:hypothetical protein|uniref:DUF6864 domain-containing function n=1 Tax=Pseudomonas salmasensis TaxID=2745514 RepID=UPI00321BB4FC
MADLKVKSLVDGRYVVKTEVVHLKEALGFEIDIQGYKVHIAFKFDEGGSRYTGKADNGYYIECYNHTSPTGDSIFTPFSVAKLNGKSIWMTYLCTTLNSEKNIRRFEYSIWMEP